ncbi:ABC transporter ATP-binding protein [Dethiothermospora halolimnae]|uniref:ABC transporter ATP-binding protein n=1 Tax=Dethiothermospora halolimnae TaxID=3114390 RepID=UPI003CCBAF58
MYTLTLENIQKFYKKDFKLNVDKLIIKKGEFFGIVGPSGCGKTTLLNLIAGLSSVDKGKIYKDNIDITMETTQNRNISVIFQDPLLFPHMTVGENIEFGLKMKKENKKDRIEKVENILKIVGLKGFFNRRIDSLSGGQKQRVSIARSLVTNPEIILMDEPFSSLDPSLRDDMRKLILDIHKRYKTTIVFVSHDRDEAYMLFDKMAILNNGKVIDIGTPRDLYENPNNIYTSKFLGINNIFYGRFHDGFFISNHFKITLKGKGKGYIIIRPETFTIGNGELKGIIEDISFRQGLLYIDVKVKDTIIDVISKEDIKLRKGDSILLSPNKEKIIFIEEGEYKC